MDCDMKMKMVILGPPGSGKGTIARIISKIYCLSHIVTGDLLRNAVRSGSFLGKHAEKHMEKGELVPDEIVITLIKERLIGQLVNDGFILDGFPRNTKQADALEEILEEKKTYLTHVINLIVDDEIIIGRLSLRRSCPRCGAVYHLKNNPPKTRGICNECGGQLVHRTDDREEIIRHRLEVYKQKSASLIDRYQESGLLKNMSGNLPFNEIPCEIRKILGRKKS
jgi:adenylate kinase